MRVKITKTVDLSDLAGESRRMLDQVKNKIMYGLPDQMSQIVRVSLSNQAEEFFQSIELIDKFRQQLAAIDENLQEVHNIMQGYKNALMPPQHHTHSDDSAGVEEAEETDEADEEYSEKIAAQEKAFMEKYHQAIEENKHFLESRGYNVEMDNAEWAANEQAEYEKFMSRVMDVEENNEPAENEEG